MGTGPRPDWRKTALGISMARRTVAAPSVGGPCLKSLRQGISPRWSRLIGNFYGATSTGGANGEYGTIFKITIDGALTSLFSFNGANGASPRYGPLAQAADGSFYGTTYLGGASNRGTIFRLSLTPSPPVLQTVIRAGSTLTLTWSAEAGHTYQVQFLTDLTQTNWSSSGGLITATNSTSTASDTIGADRQRYYRVVLSP